MIRAGARARILEGGRLSFDDESWALHGLVNPHNDEAHFQAMLR